ncbi:hypothetical protein PFICI_06091 [Pestalotiopsis fici W106-1]|uniref:Uncharacterized protein n=1 Tax=Pestalotiopsis fici (strain W106-1 / CGMCC3.15140) TaxID=1229662 RepID=W3X503_PESFW|nr:uncharacterized protein PFICI_06091 [Pestalotiopsis fici W106-1]ETS81089.1 hypothetical protein PFICI_06091 [Pestalotiopsis fici W106-1]
MPQSTWASIARGPHATPPSPTVLLGQQSTQHHDLHMRAPCQSGDPNGRPIHPPQSSMDQQMALPRQRKDAHRPRTGPPRARPEQNGSKDANTYEEEEEDCYVLTLLTDGQHNAEMSALRRQWFPAKLRKVDAHVTLFHALPASRLEQVRADIGAVAARTARFPVRAQPRGVFRMGKGVGVEMDRESLARVRALREGLRVRWNNEEREVDQDGTDHGEGGWLSEQDARRGWKGHYTVMNKENDRARMEACYKELSHDWKGSKGVVGGLTLWKYDKGWWKKSQDFHFKD